MAFLLTFNMHVCLCTVHTKCKTSVKCETISPLNVHMQYDIPDMYIFT